MTVKFDDLDSVSLPTRRRFPMITPAMVRRHQPCVRYTAAGYLEKLLGAGKTPLQVLEHRYVPLEDRLWLLDRVLDETTLRLMCAAVASTMLVDFEFYSPDVHLPRSVLETSLRYAFGDASKKELREANGRLLHVLRETYDAYQHDILSTIFICTEIHTTWPVLAMHRRALRVLGSEKPIIARMRKVLQSG